MRAEGYADVLFAVNLAMDFFLFSAAGAVLRVHSKVWRRITAAAVAALLYCMLAFGLPAAGVWSVPLGTGVLALGLAVAYCPVPPRLFGKLMATSYILAFVTGGVMNALAALAGPEHAGATLGLLTGGTTVSYIVLHAIRRHLRGHEMRKQAHCAVTIHLGERTAACTGLIDTGNTLRDPITHAPVLVAELGIVQNVLPVSIVRLLHEARGDDLPSLLEACRSGGMETRLRLLPFTSVGTPNGLLIGFRTDRVVITNEDGTNAIVSDALVGIYHGALDGEGVYRALLNPAMLA